ncbi:hypothetical protein [Amycolatopsis sp. NPDC051716]|uniref:hypothetical protein n=1 Tax=Amycolatopsis sp. NPDC051716 TaxID=3155804 RepID=UPI00343E8DFE
MAVDVEASTTRRNPDKIRLRAALYEMFEAALHTGGITRRRRDPLVNCGDGILTLIRPSDRTPKTLLLNRVVPTLDRLLAAHNANHPAHCLRLRAAVHAGEVHYDRHGCFGEAVDLTFRLLDSPELKTALSRSSTPLTLVVSDGIYQSIIRHGYDRIERHDFRPLVHVTVADQRHHGWVLSSRQDFGQHDVPAEDLGVELARHFDVAHGQEVRDDQALIRRGKTFHY